MASRNRSIRKFSDEGLVWGGWLYHNPKKRSEKTEKKSEKRRFNKSHRYWCELHREVTYYPRELRFYAKDRNGFKQKDERAVDIVPLKSDVIKVISGVEYDIPESFKIVTSKAIYIFGTRTPEEASSWSYAIWKELYGPVEPGVVYNFNVEVEQNRTTQKYNVRGSYLLKVYDKEIKLFTSNGKIPTQFHVRIEDIVKASSPPVLCLSLAVLNISTSDVGGDVMVFYTDCARDIVRIINHRRQLLLDIPLDNEFPRQSNPAQSMYPRSRSQPRNVRTHSGDPRSKTDPDLAGSAVYKGSPKSQGRKISVPVNSLYNNYHRNDFQLDYQSFSDVKNPDHLIRRPPAPLPRSPASQHKMVNSQQQQSWTSRDSISSSDSGSSGGYVIDSLVRNSYLKLFSSLEPLDIVYKDPQQDNCLRRSNTYQANSDGESNYSDSELWLCKRQRLFSRKSKRFSQNSSHRSSTVSYHRSISEKRLFLGRDAGENSRTNLILRPKSHNVNDTLSDDSGEKSLLPMCSASSVSQRRTIYQNSDLISQYNSDSKLDECNGVMIDPVHERVNSSDLAKEEDESNYSDGELWLCAGQRKFSKRSKRISKKEQQKEKAHVTNPRPTKPKIKPPIVPKPKYLAKQHAKMAVERSFSLEDQRLQNEFPRRPLAPSGGDHGNSSSAENSTNKTDLSQDITSLNKHHAVRNIQCLPLPPSPLESQSSSLVQHKCSHQWSNNVKDIADNDVDAESNQSDSEVLLGKAQKDFARRSKKLSKKGRNLIAGQNNSSESHEVKARMINSKGKVKPQVAPRTAPKPTMSARKIAQSMGNGESKKETSPHRGLSPASAHNPDYLWANTAVDQIASDIANSLSPTHVYSKVTSNGALPSLPIAAKPTAHLNLTLRNSNSFDDSYSPDHTYCYPYDECWLNNGEKCYDSDSEMWFGRDLKRLSQRCKRISRNSKKLRKAITNVNKLQQNLDSTGDDTVVKEKPRTSPRLFKPEAPPRKAYKQDVLPVSTSDIRDVGPMKSTYHDQHRKPSDELPSIPTNPVLISQLNWSADEDKTYLVHSATPAYTDCEKEMSGSGYVINTLDPVEDSVYLELESSNHIYSQPIFPMDELDGDITNDESEVYYANTQEMVK